MRAPVYEGTLEFDTGIGKAALLTHIAECLRNAEARGVKVSGDSVFFRGGIFRFVGNWNILVPFGRGELIVDEVTHEIRYRLSLLQNLSIVTIVVAYGAWITWVGTNHAPFVPFAFAFAWLAFVGSNLMFGIPRFQRFLREAIDTAPFGRLRK